MFNKIILYCILILCIYSALFTFYFFMIVISDFIKKRKSKDNENEKEYKNLIIVIYSHNNENTIVNLLEQLNKQNYPKGNYQTHIILDNCQDNSSNKLEFVGGAKLWRLSDNDYLGKDKAISWLLENLMTFKQVDAYVFLNANRIVKTDFLSNINDALCNNDVITGTTEIFLEEADYVKKILADVNEYNQNIIMQGRSNLGLAVPINSDVVIIKHKVLEKVKFIDFKDTNSELKYSFLLTKVNYTPKFVPTVKTYVSSNDFAFSSSDFLFKISLFYHCFNLRSLANMKFTEFLFSMLKPNPLYLIAIIALIALYSRNYYFLNNFPFSACLISILTVSFAVSIYKAKIYSPQQLFSLLSYPFYISLSSLFKMTFIKKLFHINKNKNDEKLKTEKISVNVNVTNGSSIFPCKLELISEGGFKRAVFKYKNKKQQTVQSYVRMCDAVKNIADILYQHGFMIRICQSCAYFSQKIDGTNNMVKGYCNQKAALDNENNALNTPETLLWSTCEKFIPQEVNNVIDILKYIKKANSNETPQLEPDKNK